MPTAILLPGLLLSLFFLVPGVAIARYRKYGLIAGYNRASPEERAEYDIESLADHVGNGLITMAVLLSCSTASLYFGSLVWSGVFFGLFLFVVLIILVGARKFMPARRRLAARAPSDAAHPFLRWLLPAAAFRALERGTREWLQECLTCGHTQDFWEAGGVRYRAIGEPTKLQSCERCQRVRWQKIRRKR